MRLNCAQKAARAQGINAAVNEIVRVFGFYRDPETTAMQGIEQLGKMAVRKARNFCRMTGFNTSATYFPIDQEAANVAEYDGWSKDILRTEAPGAMFSAGAARLE